ncbi:LysR family transcriptional regulator [Paraburkholderia sp.]|uniref:LysR family transcriptional regulator n=1 Tax=Paraburkholderia sp. TaxID=1926495 RepID=UPI003D6F6CC4
MDVAFLKSFVMVADTGSVAEAARRLDVTAAAVALQMRVLERELGVPLLARAGRTVQPTDAGHRVLDHARTLLRDFDHLKLLASDEYTSGELRIGTINTAMHSLMPDILARFVKAHPHVTVLIQSGTSLELYEALQRGEYDAAVCLHPRFALPKTFAWEHLRDEPLVVLAPQRWAKRDPHELLATQPLVRYDRSLGGGKQADQYLRKAGIAPIERFELNSLVAIGMMVERGLGVSLMPDISSPLLAGLRVAKLPLPVKTEPRRFGVLWQRQSVRAKLIRDLLDTAHVVVGH